MSSTSSISQLVIDEASAGDADAAARRLEVLAGIPVIASDEIAEEIAEILISQVPLPERATSDAFHIALAAVRGVDYILTWNFTHIANATLRPRIEAVCRSLGYAPPVICTPEQLLKGLP